MINSMSIKTVVLFGQTGAGKSSLVNLMAGEEKAKTSYGLEHCTLRWEEHLISFNGYDFKVFDTAGIDEPQLGIDEFLAVIENSYNLIMELQKQGGGIDLLLFCVRAGRFTSATQSNYRLFYEFMCQKKVPIVLVVTGLEREPHMDDWWTESKPIFDRSGVVVDGHACITAIQEMAWRLRYEESRYLIRDLVLKHCCGNEGPRTMGDSWFQKFLSALVMKVLHRRHPFTRKEAVSVLTERCGMPQEAAVRLANTMKQDFQKRAT